MHRVSAIVTGSLVGLLIASASASAQVPAGAKQINVCGATVSLTYKPIPADVPANVKAFVGQWGDSKQAWDSMMCTILAVTAADKDGNVNVTYVYGAYPDWGITAPGEETLLGKVKGNALSVTTVTGTQMTYTLAKNSLSGSFFLGNHAYSVTLPKVP